MSHDVFKSVRRWVNAGAKNLGVENIVDVVGNAIGTSNFREDKRMIFDYTGLKINRMQYDQYALCGAINETFTHKKLESYSAYGVASEVSSGERMLDIVSMMCRQGFQLTEKMVDGIQDSYAIRKWKLDNHGYTKQLKNLARSCQIA